jgi:hypothetical protein
MWQNHFEVEFHRHKRDSLCLTIASSTIIQHLQQHCGNNSEHALAYYYFDFNSSAKQEVSACISSLVAQLCTKRASVSPNIKQSYDRYSHGKLQPNSEELIEMLVAVMKDLKHIFIVIDALDECPKLSERDQLLKTISGIKLKNLKNLHTLLTSRREPDIEEVLGPLLTIPAVSLQGPQVDLDIHAHITNQLATDPKLNKWSNEVKVEMENTLMSGADGM